MANGAAPTPVISTKRTAEQADEDRNPAGASHRSMLSKDSGDTII